MATRQDILVPATGQDNTAAIQAAIDLARKGPVTLLFAPGVHVSGGLRLRSDVTLHLAEGAELRFVPDYDAYAGTEVAIEAEQSNRAMITASGAERLAIIGAGRIVCKGAQSFSTGEDAAMGTRVPARLRPRVLVLDGCRDVTLRDITVLDSPMWTLHFVDCSQLSIEGLRVDNDRRMPNTDGIVIDGCQQVSITDCEIRTADDGIVLKTSARLGGGVAGECRDIRIADCCVESRSCALKLGTESFALFKDIVFEDCRIEASNRGLGIFSRDGGAVEGVRFSRIHLECQETPDGFWGSGEALTISVLDRRPHLAAAGSVRNVVVEDITGSMQGAINLVAEHPGGIADVTLNRIGVRQIAGPLGTAGRYDSRPTPKDLEPAPESEGRVNAWRKDAEGRVVGLIDYPGGMPALFAHNVRDLTLNAVEITRPVPLPRHWNPQAIVQQ